MIGKERLQTRTSPPLSSRAPPARAGQSQGAYVRTVRCHHTNGRDPIRCVRDETSRETGCQVTVRHGFRHHGATLDREMHDGRMLTSKGDVPWGLRF